MLVMAVSYLVRERDVLTGHEEWLKDQHGTPVIFDDRLAADLAAMIAGLRLPEFSYAYVAEIDTSCESVLP